MVVFSSFAGEGGKKVLEELKRLAREEGKVGADAPNGMRAFDLGTAGSSGEEKWRDLAEKLRVLREGWK